MLFNTICISIVVIALPLALFFDHRDNNQIERNKASRETGFDGKLYTALNNLYVFKNKQVYFGYEIMDFKQTVEQNEFMMNPPFENALDEIDHIIHWLDYKNDNLSEEDALIKTVVPSEPLSEDKLKAVSEAIKKGHDHYTFVKERERKEAMKRAYQEANYNDERRSNAQYGTQSMIDYQKELTSHNSEDEMNKQIDTITNIVNESKR